MNETNDLGHTYLDWISYSLCKEIGAKMASLALFSVQWHIYEKIASLKPGAGTTISGCVRRGSTVKYGARGRPSDDTWMTL